MKEMTPETLRALQGVISDVEEMATLYKAKSALSGVPPTKAGFFSYLDLLRERRPELFEDELVYNIIRYATETFNFFVI